MPDMRSRLGSIVTYIDAYSERYLVCDFCNEHKFSVSFHERYYYGFSKRIYYACNECYEDLLVHLG
jgi:hypothetical protein